MMDQLSRDWLARRTRAARCETSDIRLVVYPGVTVRCCFRPEVTSVRGGRVTHCWEPDPNTPTLVYTPTRHPTRHPTPPIGPEESAAPLCDCVRKREREEEGGER